MLTNINVTNITTSQGITINPGGYVSSAGDVNADGFADFFIKFSSYAYLIWGTTKLVDINTTNMDSSQGIKIYGNIGHITGVGDINADGFDDFLIGVPTGGDYYQGVCYIIYGASNLQDIDLDKFDSSQGITITGANYGDSAGYFISNAGDVNNDGYDDFLIGTSDTGTGSDSGKLYLLFGGTSLTNIDLASLASSQGITIYLSSTYITAATALQDVNSDGYDDILINTLYMDSSETGYSYLIFGHSSWSNMNLANFDISQGITIQDTNNYNDVGWDIGGTGDVNADGYNDFLISTNDSITYLVWGKENWANINLANFNNATIITSSASLVSGGLLTGLQDINNDGYDDFGMRASVDGVVGTSTLYIFLGKDSWANTDLGEFNSSQGITIQGLDCESLSGIGDANKDGYDDMLMGASTGYADYLIWGNETSSNSSTTHSPTKHTTPSPVSPPPSTMPPIPTISPTDLPHTLYPSISPTNDTHHHSNSGSGSWTEYTIIGCSVAGVVVLGLIGYGVWRHYNKMESEFAPLNGDF
ncbi:MAG: FG-GAP repeat protein [Rickettsiales bacterium]|nr:FG-GAP repeat protein [Rickettsiales bacterium]